MPECNTSIVNLHVDEKVFSKALDYTAGNMYTKEVEGFSKAVLENMTVPVTAEQGIFNQKIVEAVYESQEKGKRISL